MAIPNVTSITEGTDLAGGTFSLTLPGSSSSYLLILSLQGGSSPQDVTSAPANWTLLQTQAGNDPNYAQLVVYYANASASPGTSVTVDAIAFSSSSWLCVGLDIAISSINQEAWTSHAGEPGTFTSPSVTTTVDGCLIVRCAASDMYTSAAPVATYPCSTENQEQAWIDGTGGSNDGAWSGVATVDQASQGSTGTGTWGQSAGVHYSPIGGTFAVVGAAGDATATPGVIALTTTVPKPNVAVAAAPAVIARSVVLPAPAVSVAAAPAVITAPVALPAPGVSVGAAPGVIVSTASLPAPVVSIGAAPGVVALVVTMPQATPGESGSVTASPAVIAAMVALPASAVSVAAAPSSIALAGTLPAPAVSIGAAPAVIATGATLPAPALSVGAAPAAIALPITLPAPTIDSGGANATASPAVVGVVLSMPQPAVSVAAAPAVITAVVASPQAVPAIHYTATPGVIVSTITLPAPTVSVGAAPQVLAVIVSLPQATTSTGGGYQIHGRLSVILAGTIEPTGTGGPAGVIG